ncbi:MAG: SpoVG family protein [Halanaerobiales bacterium]
MNFGDLWNNIKIFLDFKPPLRYNIKAGQEEKNTKIIKRWCIFLNITEVRIFLPSRKGSTKAYANITFDDSFVIRNLKVVEGKNGLFVSMPARQLKDGDYQDICFPITAEFREKLQSRVIKTYKEEIA